MLNLLQLEHELHVLEQKELEIQEQKVMLMHYIKSVMEVEKNEDNAEKN